MSEADDGEANEVEIAQQLAPFVLPNKRAEAVQVVTTMIRKVHSGPLPAPEDFAQYDHILPGAAERIFQLTEREQSHRHKQESRMVAGEYATRIIGQMGALLTIALLVGLAGFCAWIGQPLAAAGITAIGGAGAVFLKYSARVVDKPEPVKQPQPKRKRK